MLTEQTYLRLLSTFNYANSSDKNVNIKFQQNIKHNQSRSKQLPDESKLGQEGGHCMRCIWAFKLGNFDMN